MKNLDVKGPPEIHANDDSDPIDISLNKIVDNPSTLKIKEYFNEPAEFSFSEEYQIILKKKGKFLYL